MANNFSDASATISNASLTDIFTASNKSMVIAGTLSNTGTSAINVTIKKYDNSATATFTIIKDAPLPVGSSLEVPKIVLNTSDKVQAQSSSSSGTLDVALQLLTDVAQYGICRCTTAEWIYNNSKTESYIKYQYLCRLRSFYFFFSRCHCMGKLCQPR